METSSDLTAPSPRYRLLVVAVGAALALFLLVYFGLLLSSVEMARLTFWQLQRGDPLMGVLGVGAIAVLGVVSLLLLLPLFGVLRSTPLSPRDAAITEADQPELFARIRDIADRAGAPRPDAVYLEPDVNMAVAFGDGMLELVLPARKSLILGVAAIEALTVSQLDAVLAHEFGHFGQSSTRLGRWVYKANHILWRLVHHRTFLDDIVAMIRGGCGWRMLVAGLLLGWVFSSVRWGMQALFAVLGLPERALGREMEFHADKVAVSIAGSDAIVEALARLTLADRAFDLAVQDLALGAQQGVWVADLYARQAEILAELAQRRGASAPDLEGRGPSHRVFGETETTAQPKMWASHPPNHERERSAKAPFVDRPCDDRPAWVLFREPQQVKARITDAINRSVLRMPEGAVPIAPDTPGLPDSRLVELVQDLPALAHLPDPDTGFESASDDVRSDEALKEAMAAGHGPAILAELDGYQRRSAELNLLLAIAGGSHPLAAGLRFRGQALEAQDVRAHAEVTRAEMLEDIASLVAARDEARRAVRAAAHRLGPAWVAAHTDAVRLLYAAEHAHRAIRRGTRDLPQLVFKDSTRRMRYPERVPSLCARLRASYDGVAAGFSHLELLSARLSDAPLLEGGLIPPPPPTVWDPRWVERFLKQSEQLSERADAVLPFGVQKLIAVERAIEAALAAGDGRPCPFESKDVPPSSAAPLDPRQELRAIEIPDRVQPDRGWLRDLGGLVVVAGIFAAIVGCRIGLASSAVRLYNGTGSDQIVRVDGDAYAVGPGELRTVRLFSPRAVDIATETADGPVDVVRFERDAGQVVYNIDRRGFFVEYEIVYVDPDDPNASKVQPKEPVFIGNPLLFETNTANLLEDPPDEIQISGTTRREYLLDAGATLALPELLALLRQEAPDAVPDLARSILRHDPPRALSVQAATWLREVDPDEAAALANELRLQFPDAIEAHRAYRAAAGERVVEAYRKRALELDTAAAWFQLGAVADPAEARDAHRRALALAPDHEASWCALADPLARTLAWEEVPEALSKCTELPVVQGAERMMLATLAARWSGPVEVSDALLEQIDTFASRDPLRGRWLRVRLAAERAGGVSSEWITGDTGPESELWLAAGDLEHAASTAGDDPGIGIRLALSRGAPPEWGPRALDRVDEAGPETLFKNDAVLAAVLAAREGRSSEPYLAHADSLTEAAHAVLTADLADPEALDDAIAAIAARVGPFEQGLVYAAAAARVGPAAPPQLSDRARRLSVPGTAPLVW